MAQMFILRWATEYKDLDVMNYLTENGAYIRSDIYKPSSTIKTFL